MVFELLVLGSIGLILGVSIFIVILSSKTNAVVEEIKRRMK